MNNDTQIAIKGSTQEHLPLEDVKDGLVILKDGSCATVLRLSSVNFDLLSEREQEALVYAYGGILNSLTFPIQIMIRSSIKDVSEYVKSLLEKEKEQTNELLQEKIRSYRNFVEEVVKKNNVLTKSFYITIPFSSLELGIKSAAASAPWGIGGKGKEGQKLPHSKEYILEKAKASLDAKISHVIRVFGRLGLQVRQLETKELIQLFYEIYNEDTAGTQRIETTNYLAVAVEGVGGGKK
jgi:type IV secretory pathway VirB4 component